MSRKREKPKFTFEEKIKLARRAALADERQFYDICRSHNLITSELAYWCDAYRASGESGLKALGHVKKAPQLIMLDAKKAVLGFLKRHYPEEKFKIVRKGNRLTIYHIYVSDFDENIVDWPLFQIRYLEEENTWHIYWMRVSGKWWPYVAEGRIRSLYDCLQAFRNDGMGCFWG